MGWFQKCIQTYDDNIALAGKVTETMKYPLTPLFFISQNVQIEITINKEGEFISAERLENEPTLIPVTESSGSRSSGIAAHPLCDNLGYIAMGSQGKKYQAKYENYLEGLKSWAESEYSHELVKAVLVYVQKQTILADLLQNNTISNELPKDKLEKYFVRFAMIDEDGERVSCTDCLSLFHSYEDYYKSQNSKNSDQLCYVTGEIVPIAVNHPRGILGGSPGAKLISANDNSNYTFRGRFTDGNQALVVGNTATQKAHNALRWVVANQRYICGNRVFVVWNTKDIKVTSPFGWTEEEEAVTTKPEYQNKVRKFLNGQHNALSKIDSNIQIMSLQAATPGRLSVTYYNELAGDLYFKRIADWYVDCCWYFRKNEEEIISSPKPTDIIKFAFGSETGSFVDLKEDIFSEQMQTIFHSIVDGGMMPVHIKQALERKCSVRAAYSDGNYGRLLRITCAVLNKYYKDYKNKEIKMKLDTSETNRSYLFGRILAIAERIERSTYSKDEQGREPNAIRLWSAFVQHPMSTWMTLEGLLSPYFQKLKPSSRTYYRNLLAEVVSLFQEKDLPNRNRQLEDLYLIGYYLQRREFIQYNQIENNEVENKEEE